MNISLAPELESFVQQKIASGSYKSLDEVVNASLRLLQKYDEGKLKRLREDIMAAYEQSQRGESAPLDMEAIISAGLERLENKRKAS